VCYIRRLGSELFFGHNEICLIISYFKVNWTFIDQDDDAWTGFIWLSKKTRAFLKTVMNLWCQKDEGIFFH
jgi:hypothetical protein